jgi:hypothetical protein
VWSLLGRFDLLVLLYGGSNASVTQFTARHDFCGYIDLYSFDILHFRPQFLFEQLGTQF